MKPKDIIKRILKQATIINATEIDNLIKDKQTDQSMRAIKFDIRNYGSVQGRKIA
jgi:hypothetical protein